MPTEILFEQMCECLFCQLPAEVYEIIQSFCSPVSSFVLDAAHSNRKPDKYILRSAIYEHYETSFFQWADVNDDPDHLLSAIDANNRHAIYYFLKHKGAKAYYLALYQEKYQICDLLLQGGCCITPIYVSFEFKNGEWICWEKPPYPTAQRYRQLYDI